MCIYYFSGLPLRVTLPGSLVVIEWSIVPFFCCCSICSYVTYLRNNLEIIYYTANSCQPSWLSHVQLSLQLVQPRWGVGDGLFQLKWRSHSNSSFPLFMSQRPYSSLHIVSAWTITVSSLGSPSPQHEARQEKTSTVPNSTGGPSSWGRYESIVQFLNKAFLTLPPSTLSWATKEGSSCSSNVVEEPHNLQALVWIE